MVTLKTTSPNPVKNIFKNPIASNKEMLEKHSEKKRKRNLRTAYAYLAVVAVLLIGYSVSFLYPQLDFYLKASAQIEGVNEEIRNYDNVILPGLKTTNELHKAAYNNEFQEVEDALGTVFPEDIDKLGIVTRLENFATSIHAKTPPFEFNSMTFGEPIEKDGYTALPISTSIHSSRTNFDRFIQLVNLSGNLESDILIRLMEISNISIRYRGVDIKTGEDKGVDFTVKLNAYSR